MDEFNGSLLALERMKKGLEYSSPQQGTFPTPSFKQLFFM